MKNLFINNKNRKNGSSQWVKGNATIYCLLAFLEYTHPLSNIKARRDLKF